ncbi:MAG: O-acetyl-ADP-ribose deacetylase [Candidatus Omnitrophica bacterium]|nr:O-acetyl-ADP-ribose deacetylase [Candidatus Omnitrophota bacterium]
MATLKVVQCDITKLQVDAIVNAANQTLLGGGGVDGAIHHAAGTGLFAECATLDGCATGDAKITKGYNLPAKHVIHAVGPVWRGGDKDEPNLLRSCYRRCLEIAREKELTTIAFPCISTGIYHFPKEHAARIAVETVQEMLPSVPSLDVVVFVCFSRNNFEIYQSLLERDKDNAEPVF